MAEDGNQVPSATPPELFSYEIPGGVVQLKELRIAERATRFPRADYARGSDKDRAGNRG